MLHLVGNALGRGQTCSMYICRVRLGACQYVKQRGLARSIVAHKNIQPMIRKDKRVIIKNNVVAESQGTMFQLHSPSLNTMTLLFTVSAAS